MGSVEIAVVLLEALAVLVLLGGAVSYNRFARQRNLVRESWSQVDVELARRHDLVPNLVRAVQAYAAHEQRVFAEVAAARAAAAGARSAPPVARAGAETALNRAVGDVLAIAESNPRLRASGNFLALQRELVDTEDRIAAARRFYNGNVRDLNTRVESVPSSLVAAALRIRPAEYFPLDDLHARQARAIDLGSASP